MKTIATYIVLLSLLLVPPIWADDVQKLSASGEVSPDILAATQSADALIDQGEILLKNSRYAAAEQIFREASAAEASSIPGSLPAAERGLSEALAAQGKTKESLDLYRVLIYKYPYNLSSVAQEVRTRMGFASLLSQVGQWEEAVSVYEKSIPNSAYGDAPKLNVHFDPSAPMPLQLQAMAHVATGIEYTGYGRKSEAFSEFEKGERLAPDSAFANYYYGYGWQSLDPKDKLKLLDEAQAKAALQKAVRIGKGKVKEAATKALQVAMKTR